MSTPTHEPPDPELWGRVVEIWASPDIAIEILFVASVPAWTIVLANYNPVELYEGTGPTWNDAARALIAEWEGRK